MENDDKNKYQTKLDRAIEQSERHTRMLKNKVPNALGKFASAYCNSDWKLSKNGRVKVNWISASKGAPQPKHIQLSDDDKNNIQLGRFLNNNCQIMTRFDKDDRSKLVGVCIVFKGHQYQINW